MGWCAYEPCVVTCVRTVVQPCRSTNIVMVNEPKGVKEVAGVRAGRHAGEWRRDGMVKRAIGGSGNGSAKHDAISSWKGGRGNAGQAWCLGRRTRVDYNRRHI